jgi:Phosphoribosyl transferase domain
MFDDREQAGRDLAAELAKLRLPEPVVLALPRGGVPVAAEVAAALAAPLDLVIVRKIGAPGNPELAVAAIVDGDPPDVVLNREIIEAYALSNSDLAALIKVERPELERRRLAYRGRTSPLVDRRKDGNPGRRRCRHRYDDESGRSRHETSCAARGGRRPAGRPARDSGGAIPGSGQGRMPQPTGTFPRPRLPLSHLSPVDRR